MTTIQLINLLTAAAVSYWELHQIVQAKHMRKWDYSNCLWEPSQNGGFLVCLQLQKYTVLDSSTLTFIGFRRKGGSIFSFVTGSNLWVPSQNG